MNLLQILFSKGIYNAPALRKLENRNKEDLWVLNWKMEQSIGYSVNIGVLKTVALRGMLDNYTLQEIIEVLQHYNMLRGTDNMQVTQQVWDTLTKDRTTCRKENEKNGD